MLQTDPRSFLLCLSAGVEVSSGLPKSGLQSACVFYVPGGKKIMQKRRGFLQR